MYSLTTADCKRVVDNAARYIYKYSSASGRHFLVTGLSGGLDSAVTIALVAEACKLARADDYLLVNVAAMLPCESDDIDIDHAGLVIDKYGAEEIYRDLTNIYRYVMETACAVNTKVRQIFEKYDYAPGLANWDDTLKLSKGNVKARLRMALGTYYLANLFHSGMVMSTDNLSEFWHSFWTLHGDVGDFGPIQNVMKGQELYDIARYLEIPQPIIDRVPSDGLKIHEGGDAVALDGEYDEIDLVMIHLIQGGFNPDGSMDQLNSLPLVPGVSIKKAHKRAGMVLKSAWKRKLPVNLTRKQLGLPEIADIQL